MDYKTAKILSKVKEIEDLKSFKLNFDMSFPSKKIFPDFGT